MSAAPSAVKSPESTRLARKPHWIQLAGARNLSPARHPNYSMAAFAMELPFDSERAAPQLDLAWRFARSPIGPRPLAKLPKPQLAEWARRRKAAQPDSVMKR